MEAERSFYETRRAEYEFKLGNISEAYRLIDDAAHKTPGIFSVHVLRAEIYLDHGNKTVAFDEIKKMRAIVYRVSGSERFSNLRSLLEVEASYYAAKADYDTAKDIYRRKGVFTEKEAEDAIKQIEYDQAYRGR